MKKYFVYFTYRKLLPHSQEVTAPQFTFEVIELFPDNFDNSPSLNTSGVLLALANRGYKEEVTVIHMNPL